MRPTLGPAGLRGVRRRSRARGAAAGRRVRATPRRLQVLRVRERQRRRCGLPHGRGPLHRVPRRRLVAVGGHLRPDGGDGGLPAAQSEKHATLAQKLCNFSRL